MPRLVDIDAADLTKSNLLDRVHGGEIDGVVVHDLFTADRMRAIAERLQSPATYFDADILELKVTPGRLSAIGVAISRFGGDDFFRAAEAVGAGIRQLFCGGPDFQHTVDSAISLLAAGRAVRRAVSPVGEPFAPYNVRVTPDAGAIPAHAENNHLAWPGYQCIASQIDATTVLSAYVLVAAPESGGELVIYDVSAGDPRVHVPDHCVVDLSEVNPRSTTAKLKPGSLILFDGGRRYHGVTPVQGVRVTIGGFVTLSSDQTEIVSFS